MNEVEYKPSGVRLLGADFSDDFAAKGDENVRSLVGQVRSDLPEFHG